MTTSVPTIAVFPEEKLTLDKRLKSGYGNYAEVWKKTINQSIQMV